MRRGRHSSWWGRRRPWRRLAASTAPGGTELLQQGNTVSAQPPNGPPRAVQRFIPKQSITVAVNEDGFPLACGQVRDLSESGACVVTDLVLQRGWRVDLKVSLNSWGVFETQGRVVWSGEGPPGEDEKEGASGKVLKSGFLGAVLHGVQFTGLPDAVRSQLKGLLSTNAFDLAPSTLRGAADRTPFQEMLEALQPELDRLGVKMD